jgi:hypothetical protein
VVPICEIAAARIIHFDFENRNVCLAMTDGIGTVTSNRQLRGRHCESPSRCYVIANRRQKHRPLKKLPAMWQSLEKKLEPEAIISATTS